MGTKGLKAISLEEVKKHTKPKDLWTIIHGNVYNVSDFAEEHPGGLSTLLSVAGDDGTDEFEDAGHSSDARELMEQFCIGTLTKEPSAGSTAPEDGKKKCRFNNPLFYVPLATGLTVVAAILIYRSIRK